MGDSCERAVHVMAECIAEVGVAFLCVLYTALGEAMENACGGEGEVCAQLHVGNVDYIIFLWRRHGGAWV